MKQLIPDLPDEYFRLPGEQETVLSPSGGESDCEPGEA